VLALVLLAGLTRPVRADEADRPTRRPLVDGQLRQAGIGIELGVIVGRGATEYGVPSADLAPAVEGLVLRDRNGMSSRMVIGLLVAVAGAMAQSGPKSVESHSYRSGDYLVTETTTTYYSEAEKAEMREATSRSIDGLFAAPYSDMELHLFSRDRFGRGQASGYHLNFFVGSGKRVAFETGFGFGKVTSLVDGAGGAQTRVAWKYLEMPLRISTVAGPARLALTYEWNWLKYGVEDGERAVHAADRTSQGGKAARQVDAGGRRFTALGAEAEHLRRCWCASTRNHESSRRVGGPPARPAGGAGRRTQAGS
jgi:hypothetical protein